MSGLYDPKRDTGAADRAVAALAAEEWSVLSLDELRGCGLSETQVRGRVRAGHLHRLHPRVYAVGHDAPPLQGRWLAAVKAVRGSVLSHFAAAALWGLVEWDGRVIEVTVASSSARSPRGVRAHRTRRLERADVRSRDGIPATAPERTLIDLAVQLEARPLRRALGQALSDRLVSVPGLLRVIERHTPRPGLARLRAVGSGAAPTRSLMEDVFLELIDDARLERPLVNHRLELDGRRPRPDFLWPRLSLIVETDGGRWHDHEIARADDAERQALLEQHGYRVLRVRWAELVGAPRRVVMRLRDAGVGTR